MAARQRGVVATRQLEALGIARPAISRMAADGRLIPIHRGVFAVGHAALRVEGRWIAAVLAGGPEAALSHRSGALLWNVARSNRAATDITVPRGTGGAHRQALITVHRCKLDPVDVTRVDGIAVTALPRTLLDLAEVVPYGVLEGALDEAEKLRILDLDAVLELIARTRGRRGLRPLRRAIDLYRPEPAHRRSWLERHALPMLAAAGIPRPRVNLWLHGQEVDLHWPRQRLVVELDSRTHHHTTLAFEEDRRRDAALTARGYRVMRFTHRRVTREPEQVTAQLAAALSAAAAGR